jgi:hypothetical protein
VTVQVGDKVLLESERAGQQGRSGVVEEILCDEPQRLRVRWDDGRESIFVPAAGVARIAPRPRSRRQAAAS